MMWKRGKLRGQNGSGVVISMQLKGVAGFAGLALRKTFERDIRTETCQKKGVRGALGI